LKITIYLAMLFLTIFMKLTRLFASSKTCGQDVLTPTAVRSFGFSSLEELAAYQAVPYKRKICSAPDCGHVSLRGKVCRAHDALVMLCSAPGCNNQTQSGGVCKIHEAPVKGYSAPDCKNQAPSGGATMLPSRGAVCLAARTKPNEEGSVRPTTIKCLCSWKEEMGVSGSEAEVSRITARGSAAAPTPLCIFTARAQAENLSPPFSTLRRGLSPTLRSSCSAVAA